jgi:hypothetical protein
MDKSGIGFIVGDDFCACSDDVIFDIEKDIIPGSDKKNLVQTQTLKLLSIFDCVGQTVKGAKVFCLFKSGEIKQAFVGTVRGKSGNLTVIDLTGTSPYINEIIHKIKFLTGGK